MKLEAATALAEDIAMVLSNCHRKKCHRRGVSSKPTGAAAGKGEKDISHDKAPDKTCSQVCVDCPLDTWQHLNKGNFKVIGCSNGRWRKNI